MENNEVQALEETAKVATNSGLTGGQKTAIVITASVLTAGIVFGVVSLVKHVKAKKAAKGEVLGEEVHE